MDISTTFHFLGIWVLAGASLLPLHAEPAGGPEISLALVGDSTVAEWAEAKPARGWGQSLAPFLIDDVKITNLAVCGASTKTFPATGNWKKAVEGRPTFVLIQFGHNDSHAPGLPESTSAGGEYTENLRRYVAEARAAGSMPILITPMHRRMFDSTGQPTRELEPYAVATRKVAGSEQVPLIDLYQSSGDLLARLGEAGSAGLTVSDKDRTHFTPEGAAVMAGLVADGMREGPPALARLVKPAPAQP